MPVYETGRLLRIGVVTIDQLGREQVELQLTSNMVEAKYAVAHISSNKEPFYGPLPAAIIEWTSTNRQVLYITDDEVKNTRPTFEGSTVYGIIVGSGQ